MGPIKRFILGRSPSADDLMQFSDADITPMTMDEFIWAVGCALFLVSFVGLLSCAIGEPISFRLKCQQVTARSMGLTTSRASVTSRGLPGARVVGVNQDDDSHDYKYIKKPREWAEIAAALAAKTWKELANIEHNGVRQAAVLHLDQMVEGITSLLLLRIAAHHCDALKDCYTTARKCENFLKNDSLWPANVVDNTVAIQLGRFVRQVLVRYNDLPYHNGAHAYHVFMSAHHLLEQLLGSGLEPIRTSAEMPPSFGIRRDTLAHIGLLFAALVHDVEHEGVPNRQLVAESSPLALQFNDVSVAEQHSLVLVFDLLNTPSYSSLRKCLFHAESRASRPDDYVRFRKMVIQLVLCTDIADADKMQAFRSKWKQAFGETPKTTTTSENNLKQMDRYVADSADESIHSMDDGWSVDSNDADVQKLRNIGSEDSAEAAVSPRSFETSGGGSPLRKLSSRMLSRRASRKKVRRGLLSQSMPARNQSINIKNFRKVLDVRRSVDLTGEFLETFSQSYNLDNAQDGTNSGDQSNSATRGSMVDEKDDPVDELKATVVMQVIMMAADVSPNLQGWNSMVEWSGHLYREVSRAHENGRGAPSPLPTGWYENQLGFLESYVLPLTRRLHQVDVLPSDFTRDCWSIVTQNRDRWLAEGHEVSADICTPTGEPMSKNKKV